MCKSETRECIRDDHGRTTSRGQEPDATFWIEEAEFEACSCLTIEFLDVLLTICLLRTKRVGESESCPIFPLTELLTVIHSGNHIETYDRSISGKSKRIDFEIGKPIFSEK
jgi:hypothetical protein